MYRAIEEGDSSRLLIDERDGKVVGFVAGGNGMGPIYRRMFRRPFRLAWALAPTLLHPGRILRIAEILRYSAGKAGGEGLPHAELLSIAVDPEWRGKQVAEDLYQRLMGHFRDAGISDFRILVGEKLASAHKFYLRMGAKSVGEIVVHGRETSVIYVQSVQRQEGRNVEHALPAKPA
jgi:ribosomal protein S18 acetylase RimI-like enzyme